jgi:pyruvate/2-oxoglutarate dehydrogenase complex dihydrolipoamide dehydrogenase (E3) component
MVPPHKEDLENIIKFYEAQLKKMGNVTLKLGVEATAKTVKDEKPDAVIIATGSEPIIPPIPGVNGANVVTAQAVLTGQAKVGKDVVIVGFGMVGCETADFLAEQGKTVTLVDMRDASEAAVDVNFLSRICLLGDLTKKAVKIVGFRPVNSITTEGVNVIDPHGNTELLKADTVVLAVGSKSVAGLEPQIASLVKESYIIGDAMQPRKIRQAIWEGFRCCYEL